MPILRDNGVFCVNTLRAGDELIADMFAGPHQGRARASASTPAQWMTLATGAPVLDERGGRVRLPRHRGKAVGRHMTFIFGAVEAVRLGAPGAALVYHERAYKQV